MANSNSPPPRRGVCPRRGDTMRALFFFFFFSVLVFIADRHVQGKKWEPMDGPRVVAT